MERRSPIRSTIRSIIFASVKVSVVVPAFNEEKLIQDTLRHINRACEAFHTIGWQTELIVCDNNSSDATAAIARNEGAQVVFEPINQIGRARNTGAAAATGDWLIFVDADSHPSPELFSEVAGAISSDGISLAAARSGWHPTARAFAAS